MAIGRRKSAKPTVLNNVETFANVPRIILNGAGWYCSIVPGNSPGAKTFALSGNMVNTGLVEVPMGTTPREVVFNITGGLGQSACKPVQSMLKYFRNEYLAHVVDKHCPHCNGKKKGLKIDPASIMTAASVRGSVPLSP